MSMSSATAAARAAGGSRRVVAAVGLAIVLLVPTSVIFTQFWIARSNNLAFNQDERRGVEYLGPLTELLSTVTDQQSGIVHGRGVVTSDVQRAISSVDAVEARLGSRLQTTQRWTQLRQQILGLTGRRYLGANEAYTSYSNLVDLIVALVRKVGDSSKLILDPQIDTYYVMNAALLRIPEVLVSSGRYADLVKILGTSSGTPDADRLAQLASSRGQILAAADDLAAGLEKAFESTTSNTLGPGLLRQLDDFRTAVDRIAPRGSPVQGTVAIPLASRVETDQETLQRAAMSLDAAALDQLDALLRTRVDTVTRSRLYALIALLAGVVVASGAVAWFGPARRAAPPGPPSRPGGRHGERTDADTVDARELVASSGLALSARRGGTRAAR